MDYLFWNKNLWDYFFREDLKNTNYKIVLAVNENVILEIGSKFNIENPLEDFINAINEGPSEIVDGIQKFSTKKKDLDILNKSNFYLKENSIFSKFGTKIPRWSDSKEECLLTGYLAYLVLMITDESQYWSNVNSKLNIQTRSVSQNLTPSFFDYLKIWAKKKGYNFFFKNIYTTKKNVGTIYSQLPLTLEEEKQIITSLYYAKVEDPEEYLILKNKPTFEIIEEFIENQKSFLNNPTTKEINDYSSELRSVVFDYVFQNFDKYITFCENSNEIEIKKALELRKIVKQNIKPEYFLCIEDHKIKGVLLINTKLSNSIKEGNLFLKCKKNVYNHDTRFYRNVNDDEGNFYKAYFFDEIFESGKYKIFNNNIETHLEFEVPTFPDFKQPIWYKDYSRLNRDLKIIQLNKKIEFDINNPYKIITSSDFEFEKEEIDKYGIINLGVNFKINVQNNSDIFQIFTLSLEKIETKFELAGKAIEITDKEFEIILQGAPDGKRGSTSYLNKIPVTIGFNPTSITRIKIYEPNNTLIEISDFKQNDQNLDTFYSTHINNLKEGDYKIEVYNLNNTVIKTKEFSITIGDFSEQRSEKYLKYNICDFNKLTTFKIDEKTIEEYSLKITKELIEELIDILIKGKKIISVYDDDFKYILKTLLNKYNDFDQLNTIKLEPLEIGKRIIYILDSLNIIEREFNYIKTINKPYWISSSVDRRYNIVGALSLDDIKELNKVTSIKSNNQSINRSINKYQVVFELPRQFYVEKCDENKLPKTDKFKYFQDLEEFDFVFQEPEELEFIIDSDTLKLIDENILIPINNIKVLNWFTLKYEAIIQDQFKEMLTYWGYKLFEIESKKKYNNRVVKYYFLFSIGENGIRYAYFPYEQRHIALRLYLKKVKYFDLSHLIISETNNSVSLDFEFISNQLIDNVITDREHKKIFSVINDNPDNISEFKTIINFQNAFKIDLVFRKIIQSYFLYDKENQIFAINASVVLPENIEKYLNGLNGLLPIYFKHNAILPISNLNQLLTKNSANTEGKEIEFKAYQNIPEEIVSKISNNLIGGQMHLQGKNYLEIKIEIK